MNVFQKVPLSFVLSSCALAAAGCSRGTSYKDVQAAREDVAEEQHQTAQVQNESAESIAQAKREGAQAVQQAKQQTAEAKQDLKQTEAKYNATQARATFVAEHQEKLQMAADRIKVLQEKAANQKGDAKDATQKQIDQLQAAHDKAKSTLNDVKSADVLKWDDHRDQVKQAFDVLQKQMDQTA